METTNSYTTQHCGVVHHTIQYSTVFTSVYRYMCMALCCVIGAATHSD